MRKRPISVTIQFPLAFCFYIATVLYDTHEDAAAHCSGELLYFDDRYCLDIPFAAALNDKPNHLVPRRPAKIYGYS